MVVVKKAGPQRAVNVVVVSGQSQAVVTRGPRAGLCAVRIGNVVRHC